MRNESAITAISGWCSNIRVTIEEIRSASDVDAVAEHNHSVPGRIGPNKPTYLWNSSSDSWSHFAVIQQPPLPVVNGTYLDKLLPIDLGS